MKFKVLSSLENKLLIFFLAILLIMSTSCQKKEKEETSNMAIFLCIGQSNMAGRGLMKANDTLVLNNVLLFNNKQKWEPAKNPLNKYSTIRKRISMQQLGPSWTFAKEMVIKEGKTIGLLVNARGGSSLDEWKKGSFNYNETVIRALQAQKHGKLKGILWHQGESDRNKWNDYTQRFKTFIENLRKDLNEPNVPVIVGKIGNWKGTSDSINLVIPKLKEHIPHLDYIKTDKLSHIGDSLHFSRDAQIEIGKRYAKKYQELKLKE